MRKTKAEHDSRSSRADPLRGGLAGVLNRVTVSQWIGESDMSNKIAGQRMDPAVKAFAMLIVGLIVSVLLSVALLMVSHPDSSNVGHPQTSSVLAHGGGHGHR